jgi:hypothetical protein
LITALLKREKKALGIRWDEEEYRRIASEYLDDALLDLFYLYCSLRNDWAEAKKYLKNIKNKELVRETLFVLSGGDLIVSEEDEEIWRYFKDA